MLNKQQIELNSEWVNLLPSEKDNDITVSKSVLEYLLNDFKAKITLLKDYDPVEYRRRLKLKVLELDVQGLNALQILDKYDAIGREQRIIMSLVNLFEEVERPGISQKYPKTLGKIELPIEENY